MKRIRLVVIPLSEDMINEALEGQTLTAKERLEAVETLKENGAFRTKQALLSAMRVPLDPRSGISIEEIEKSLPIIQTIKGTEENGVLELDDDDFEYISKKLACVRINGFDERWATLKQMVMSAGRELHDK